MKNRLSATNATAPAVLQRREVLRLMGSTALAATALPMLPAWASAERSAQPGSEGEAYGSGYFGHWMSDEHGGVAYQYTCDQVRDPKAVTPTDPIFRSATDQWHQVGNDRLVATASNFGYMQVRQDEGGPKFLNDYIPSEGQFGGGIGWLSDGETILSTYFTGAARTFERIFGMGYYRKRVTDARYLVDQVVFAPFGDDPVLVTLTTLRNNGAAPATLRWTEYWGCLSYEFCGGGSTQTETHFARRIFGKQFSHDFATAPGGLLERKRFPAADREPPAGDGGARKRDIAPPATFLVALGDEPYTVGSDSKDFFDHGGVAAPERAKAALSGVLPAPPARPALFLQREVVLQAGESRTLSSLYGYLTAGQELAPLVKKYRGSPGSLLATTVAAWANDGLRLECPDQPWVARENVWSNYYLRSGATYDSFVEEHIISQGHAYQYINGFQGASRDPPLHAQPLIFSNPTLVKEVIRYTLKITREDGAVYGGVGAFGNVGGSAAGGELASDYGLWLLLLASDYVLATRDKEFLLESISLYPVRGPKARRDTVGGTLQRCARYLRDTVSVGPHGLLRVRGGDWNDNLLLSHCKDRDECQAVGESMMSAGMAAHILGRYAEMLRFIGGEGVEIARFAAFAATQREAFARQWTGSWYRRAWLGPKSGWLGEGGNLWLEPQPWAVISGAASADRARQLIGNLDRELRKPSPIGAILCNRTSTETDPADLGVAEEGGVWPAINTTLVWALAKIDPAMAWDEWQKNTLARHAAVYPDIWYGIWSGPDTFNSVYDPINPGGTMLSDLIRKPGQIMNHVYSTDFGMTDFPVMNMHPHSTPLFSLTKLIGVEFSRDGLILEPVLPLKSYKFNSPLLGLEKSASGYRGWYAPSSAGGNCTVRLRLPSADLFRFRRLTVNGRRAQATSGSRGEISFTGNWADGKRLEWSLLG